MADPPGASARRASQAEPGAAARRSGSGSTTSTLQLAGMVMAKAEPAISMRPGSSSGPSGWRAGIIGGGEGVGSDSAGRRYEQPVVPAANMTVIATGNHADGPGAVVVRGVCSRTILPGLTSMTLGLDRPEVK